MIGVIDYKAGNIASVCNTLRTIGADHFVSNKTEKLDRATKIIMPGVGEAHCAMSSLQELELIDWLKNIDIPFLGICLGMQVLFDHSDERNTTCLGIIGGAIRRFGQNSSSEKLKIPHIGWNTILFGKDHKLFKNIPSGTFFYFVHSYYAPVVSESVTRTEYGAGFTSSLQKDNYYGVQFHPEKSGQHGLQLLKNFIKLC